MMKENSNEINNIKFVPSKFFISDENGKHIIAEYDGEVLDKSQECRSHISEINRETHDENLKYACPLDIIREGSIAHLYISLSNLSIRPHNGKLWFYRENSYKKFGDRYE